MQREVPSLDDQLPVAAVAQHVLKVAVPRHTVGAFCFKEQLLCNTVRNNISAAASRLAAVLDMKFRAFQHVSGAIAHPMTNLLQVVQQ
jgi:hypothetical protein